jgi:predicted ester cyclase
VCKSYCRRPGWWTVEEASRAIEKGYGPRMMLEMAPGFRFGVLSPAFTPDVMIHEYLPGLPDTMNRTIYEQFIAGFRAALPDIHNSLEDIFANGDLVTMRWRGYGTPTGADLMQIPAAGKAVVAHGIYILRFENGKIAEVWNHWDNLNVVTQLQG